VTPLLAVSDLRVEYPLPGPPGRSRRTLVAVDGVSFALHRGETFGLVGESGCGKSSLGRAIVQLIRGGSGGKVTGRIELDGTDLVALRSGPLRRERRRLQMVFQDPFSSLNPRQSVGKILAEPIKAHGLARGPDLDRRVVELLRRVGLDEGVRERYPHEFSGGQRQRIGLARALALDPDVIVADEPVSALDVSIQAQILNLLMTLQRDLGLTILFVSHDLSVVRHVSDRVAVMYLGQLVEVAPADELYARPLHPYTVSLLSAVPVADPEVERTRTRIILSGDVPDPSAPPPGCRFHTRCPYVQPQRCRDEVPALRSPSAGREVACHYAEQIAEGRLGPHMTSTVG